MKLPTRMRWEPPTRMRWDVWVVLVGSMAMAVYWRQWFALVWTFLAVILYSLAPRERNRPGH
jgi:hypothetical protein